MLGLLIEVVLHLVAVWMLLSVQKPMEAQALSTCCA